MVNIYMDESGDLGWKFDAPYRKGGSSRYLTIAFIMCPSNKSHKLDRIVKEIYKSRNVSFKDTEVKGSSLSIEEKDRIATLTKNLLDRDSDFHLISITVDKTKVKDHIRRDANDIGFVSK